MMNRKQGKKGPSLVIEARDEDPERTELVGLDDALMELSLQANFFMSKTQPAGFKEGNTDTNGTQYGIDKIMSQK